MGETWVEAFAFLLVNTSVHSGESSPCLWRQPDRSVAGSNTTESKKVRGRVWKEIEQNVCPGVCK